MRNRRAVIGTVLELYKGLMWHNENYEKYFDLETGEPLPLDEPEDEEELNESVDGEESSAEVTPEDAENDEKPEEKVEGERGSAKVAPDDAKNDEESAGEADEDEDSSEVTSDDAENDEKPGEKIEEEQGSAKATPDDAKNDEESAGETDEDEDSSEVTSAEAEDDEGSENRADEDELITDGAGTQSPAEEREKPTDEEDSGEENETEKKKDYSSFQSASDEELDAAIRELLDIIYSPQVKEKTMGSDWTREEIWEVEDKNERIKERYLLLDRFLEANYSVIQTQSKKNPTAILNEYKVKKINALLKDIQYFLADTPYVKYLELITEPTEEEIDGIKVVKGMTNSDTELLMSYYIKAMERCWMEFIV